MGWAEGCVGIEGSTTATSPSPLLDTTRVTLDTGTNLGRFDPRTVTVHGVERELAFGTRPLAGAVAGESTLAEFP